MMIQAIILFDSLGDDHRDLFLLMQELEEMNITYRVSSRADFMKVLKGMNIDKPVLFYKNPKIRIDIPVSCVHWLERSAYDVVTKDGNTICFKPSRVNFSIPEIEIVSGNRYEETHVRYEEYYDGYLTYTGERVVPNAPAAHGNMLSHLQWYQMVLPLVKDKQVLDIACGCGYGAHLLSQEARTVVGCDISAKAVRYAKENYQSPNLQFENYSTDNFTQLKQIFDVIVSIETFEHIKHVETFLMNSHRMLATNGVLWFVTPNGDRMPYTKDHSKDNGYHERHYTREDLRGLLADWHAEITEYQNDYIVKCSPIATSHRT